VSLRQAAPDLPPTEVTTADVVPARGRVIAVWGPTGAPGRTTVAVNLAAELAACAHDADAGPPAAGGRTGLPGVGRGLLPASEAPPGRRPGLRGARPAASAAGSGSASGSHGDRPDSASGGALLVDADTYGGTVAQVVGLLDEAPGIAAAARAAGQGALDARSLARLTPVIGPRLRVLTGISRADRWPELPGSSLDVVWEVARGLAGWVVVDCGFSLEQDEVLSYDTHAPRRNAATLSALGAADVVVVVGSGDPVGVQRLVRGLAELADSGAAGHAGRVVVVNRPPPRACGRRRVGALRRRHGGAPAPRRPGGRRRRPAARRHPRRGRAPVAGPHRAGAAGGRDRGGAGRALALARPAQAAVHADLTRIGLRPTDLTGRSTRRTGPETAD
jgi:hypothetical protein